MTDGLHIRRPDLKNEIVTIKIITDQNQLLEILALYVGDVEDAILVKDPVAIVPQQDPKTGQLNIGFMNYMLSGKPGAIVEIYKSTLASTTIAKDEAVEEYKRTVNPSAIETPKIIT